MRRVVVPERRSPEYLQKFVEREHADMSRLRDEELEGIVRKILTTLDADRSQGGECCNP